jgi:hypothetical protein
VARVPGYRSRGPGFDSRLYKIFWEAVGLERGPLSLVRIIEELFERKAAPVLKTEINGRRVSLRTPRDTLYPLKLAQTSPTSGGSLVGILRFRTKTTEFVCLFVCLFVARRSDGSGWGLRKDVEGSCLWPDYGPRWSGLMRGEIRINR